MIDFKKLTSKHRVIIMLGFIASFFVLCFPLAVSMINGFNLDLAVVVGYGDHTVNFAFFLSIVTLITWGIAELIITILTRYFETARVFFVNQRVAIKVTMRFSLIFRNLILGGFYIIAFFVPVLFNWFILIEFLITTFTFLLFFFIARHSFGGDIIGHPLFRSIGRMYILFLVLTFIFEIGGMLL